MGRLLLLAMLGVSVLTPITAQAFYTETGLSGETYLRTKCEGVERAASAYIAMFISRTNMLDRGDVVKVRHMERTGADKISDSFMNKRKIVTTLHWDQELDAIVVKRGDEPAVSLSVKAVNMCQENRWDADPITYNVYWEADDEEYHLYTMDSLDGDSWDWWGSN